MNNERCFIVKYMKIMINNLFTPMIRCRQIMSVSFCMFFCYLIICILFDFKLANNGCAETITKQFTDVYMPRTFSLCGEPLPLDQQYAQEMFDRELTISAWDRAQTFMWFKRAAKYFPHIEAQLKKAGLPDDLKYLAVAESALIVYGRSSVGALGTWQFMPVTAKSNGLKKNIAVDERRSFEHSTKAAIKYLRFLKKKFNSWTIAMAAYNCGETRMKRELKKQKAKSFYELNLPLETERYIFRIAAVKSIMQNPEKYGYILPKRVYALIKTDTVTIYAKKSISIVDLAVKLGITYKIIKELNPQFLKPYIPYGRYTMKVPYGLGSKVKKVVAKLGKYASNNVSYRVRSGDTLTRISRKTGISIARLKRYNNIKGSIIKIGQTLALTR